MVQCCDCFLAGNLWFWALVWMFFQRNERWRRRWADRLIGKSRRYSLGKWLEMLGGSSVLRLVGLLWFSSTCTFTQDRTAYRGQWRNYFPARNSGRNALYSRYLRRNSSWNPMVNSMAFSYIRSNKWSKTRRVRIGRCEVFSFIL